eukprot:1437570-Rhodomonas_salina.2
MPCAISVPHVGQRSVPHIASLTCAIHAISVPHVTCAIRYLSTRTHHLYTQLQATREREEEQQRERERERGERETERERESEG